MGKKQEVKGGWKMTLYYGLLEKIMRNQPLPVGISIFCNTQSTTEKNNGNHPPMKQRTAENVIESEKRQASKPLAQEIVLPNNLRQPASVTASTQAIIDCTHHSADSNAIISGVVAKVPVILAELTIQLHVNSLIHLPQWVLEIKQIKRQLRINKCALMQNTDLLFVKGIVHKKIDYIPLVTEKGRISYGELQQFSIEVPFQCTTQVTFPGIQPFLQASVTSDQQQIFYRQDVSNEAYDPEEQGIFDDMQSLNQTSTVFYNEMPFCELTSSKITEFYETSANMDPSVPPALKKKFFDQVEEKMIISLTVKILQYRKVVIPGVNC